MGEIFNSSPRTIYKFQPLFSYRFKDRLTPDSRASEIDAFFRELASTDDDFLDQTERRSRGGFPVFSKSQPSHLVYKEVRYHRILPNLVATQEDLRLVALLRNPLAVMRSWLAAPREFRRDLGWDWSAEWRFAPSKNQNRPEEFFGFEKWKESARIFLDLEKRYPGRVTSVVYARLVSDPLGEAERLFDFCGLELSDQTLRFLESDRAGHEDDPYSVFRSRRALGDRNDDLPSEIARAIERDLRGSDLEFLLGEDARA